MKTTSVWNLNVRYGDWIAGGAGGCNRGAQRVQQRSPYGTTEVNTCQFKDKGSDSLT